MRTTLTTLAILTATLPTVALLSYQTGREHGVKDAQPAVNREAACVVLQVQVPLLSLRHDRVLNAVAQEKRERVGFTTMQTGGT